MKCISVIAFPNSHSSPHSNCSEGCVFLLSEGSSLREVVFESVKEEIYVENFFIIIITSYLRDISEMILSKNRNTQQSSQSPK